MKKKVILIFISVVLFPVSLYADQIFFTDGRIEEGKILKVDDHVIEYRREGSFPDNSVKRSAVVKIVYSNGKAVYFEGGNSIIIKDPAEEKNKWSEKNFAIGLYPLITLLYASVINYTSIETELLISGYLSFSCGMRYISDGEESLSIVSPGLRLYTSGKGMQGGFISLYNEAMFVNHYYKESDFYFLTNKILIVTSWLGYRWTWDYFYTELAAGVFAVKILKNKDDIYDNIYDDKIPNFYFAGISFGVGISF